MIKRVSFSAAAAPVSVSDLLFHSDRPASAAGLLNMKICEQLMGNSLPDSRRNKRKRANEGCQKLYSRATLKMSASHKRKLNKLKEEKENQLQFSKSAEALEKCKIPESARALLQSSRNIGQVESKKVKRSKALIHSRATTHTDQPHKTKDEDRVSSESEPESEITQLMQDLDKNLQMKSLIVQKNTSTRLDSSMMLLCGTRFGMNGGSAPASPSKNDIRKKSLREDRVVLPTSSMDHDSESTNSMDKVEDSTKSSASWANGLSNLPAPSFLKDPKSRRHVSRPPEVVKARSDIPIIMMEQEIMEAINENSTVIIRGETGCGKTTQVPQFLYEVGIGSSGCPLGSGIVGVSQPRRIAVNATANRVAYELGVHVGEEVGYQVRYDKKIGISCSIKFMTDGILLREIQIIMPSPSL